MDALAQPKKPELVQSRLTSAFFSKQDTKAEGTCPAYFTRPTPQEPSDSEESKLHDTTEDMTRINLHPERRSNLAHPPPSLGRATRSSLLHLTAAETKSLLPNILKTIPHAPADGYRYSPGNRYKPGNLVPLDPRRCPSLPQTAIRVVNSDTIDAAIAFSSSATSTPNKPVLVLNMANAYHSGGGWLRGALAQEEALCYRSSLSFTLKTRFYPLPEAGGIYSPTVVVIRENMAQGHELLDLTRPEDLPVFSCVSVAAINGPKIRRDKDGRESYENRRDRETMQEKIRAVLRIAAINKHRVLVLGALGCGAFGNPRGEVVACWKGVLTETEFQGGWWETVIFAVMEPNETKDGDGNFGVFYRGLDGTRV